MGLLDNILGRAGELGEKARDGFEAVREKASDGFGSDPEEATEPVGPEPDGPGRNADADAYDEVLEAAERRAEALRTHRETP